jgi:hypothetical protein
MATIAKRSNLYLFKVTVLAQLDIACLPASYLFFSGDINAKMNKHRKYVCISEHSVHTKIALREGTRQ